MARVLSIAVLILLGSVLVLVAGAIFSESALRTVVRYAEPHLPISVDGVSGSLYSGVAIEGFVYGSGGFTVEGSSVLLTPRWACAVRSVICLEDVSAGSLIVTFVEDGRENEATAGLPDLPEVRIDVFAIGALQVRSNENLESFLSVGGSDLALGAGGISIEGLTLSHELARASAFGELRPDGRWSLVTDVELAKDMPEITPGKKLPSRYRAEANGDFTSVSATLQSLEGMELSSTVSVEMVDESPVLKAVIDGLHSAGTHYLAFAGYEFAGGLTLELIQSGGRWFLTGEQSILDGERHGDLKLRASEQTGELILEELRVIFDPESWASATGSLGRRDALAPKLKLRFESFPVPASVDTPVDVVDGALELGIELAEAPKWRATDISLAIDGEVGAWIIAGDLSGNDTELLPVGAVLLDGPPGGFSYEKVNDLRQPAVLALREPAELGGVEVTEAALHVVTAERDELELTINGELQTVLRAEARRSLDGVEFTLEPFELRFADETIRLENPLAGSWSSNASSVSVAPFCLKARTSSLCSDALQLGSSGSAAFNLHFKEQLGNEVAGHSYKLEMAGIGRLLTTWSEGEWRDAELNLNFTDLRLDPFQENGVQGTIEFQKAALFAIYDGSALNGSLTAESKSAGVVDLDLTHSQRGLSGALRATDFNLRALDDLLPELGLEAGALSADLSIEGGSQDPTISGQLSVTGLAARVPSALTRLDNGAFTISATGAGFNIEGDALFGGGPVRLEGTCCDRETMSARLVGTRNRVELQEGLNALMSSEVDLRIGREQVAIDGDLVVHSGTLEPVIPAESGVALSRDIVRVDEAAEQDRRFDMFVALAARVEPGFTLRTKEVEATLSGDLRYVDSSTEPAALYGDLQVLGGELRAYGQTLRLSNGTVGFVGNPLNPTLQLAAEREIRGEDLRVGFRVTGRLEEPVLRLYSEPQRSERETLSYLLRGRGPDAGAALDATALALSLGATAVNQAGVLRSLDAIPGVSGVSIGAEGWDDDMAATLSAYVGERLYLSYGVGIYEPVNALTARLYLQSRLWLEVVSRLENSIDLYYRFDRN